MLAQRGRNVVLLDHWSHVLRHVRQSLIQPIHLDFLQRSANLIL